MYNYIGDNMGCPKCNIELEKGICIKCGYMENGNQIERFKDTNQNTEIRIYNEDFEIMNTNQSKLLNFIMGSYYFSYRGHLLVGLISTAISSIVLFFELKITNILVKYGSETLLLLFLNTISYLFINRILYMSFSNPICIGIDRCKIKKIKDIKKLINHKCRNILYLLTHILLSIISIIIILKKYKVII